MSYNPGKPMVDDLIFKKFGWQDFYRDTKKSIPDNALSERDETVSTHSFIAHILARDL